jgi:hypothetical protein
LNPGTYLVANAGVLVSTIQDKVLKTWQLIMHSWRWMRVWRMFCVLHFTEQSIPLPFCLPRVNPPTLELRQKVLWIVEEGHSMTNLQRMISQGFDQYLDMIIYLGCTAGRQKW